jgi:hypothetical protein
MWSMICRIVILVTTWRAAKGDNILCIEVKGRSGSDICADFTPHEYDAIQREQKARFADGSYRICIVTNALGEGKRPELHHFTFWREDGEWWSIDGRRKLRFDPVIAARATASTG